MRGGSGGFFFLTERTIKGAVMNLCVKEVRGGSVRDQPAFKKSILQRKKTRVSRDYTSKNNVFQLLMSTVPLNMLLKV